MGGYANSESVDGDLDCLRERGTLGSDNQGPVADVCRWGVREESNGEAHARSGPAAICVKWIRAGSIDAAPDQPSRAVA